MTRKIIVDASPMVVVLKSDLEFILSDLFEDVIMPEAVRQEILAGRDDDRSKPKLPAISWLKIKNPINTKFIDTNRHLGRGEATVLSVGLGEPNSSV